MPEMEVVGTKRVSDYTYDVDQLKKMKSDVKMRLLLVGRYCGLVIGKGGENLGRLRREHSVDLDMSASRTQDRVFTVDGEVENCVAIVKEILPSCGVQAPYPVGQKCAFEVNLLVATDVAGMVIGKGGEKLKEIRDQSNGRIKVYQECLPESNERVVAIGGETEEDVLGALQMILNVVKDARRRANFHPYDPNNKPSEIMGPGISGSGPPPPPMMHQGMQHMGNVGNMGNMGNMGNQQQGRGMDDPFQQLQTVTTITVPNEMCGAIIGMAGCRIKEVRNTSGARIEFAETEQGQEGTRTRTITVTGTQHQVNVAEQLMAECVRNRVN